MGGKEQKDKKQTTRNGVDIIPTIHPDYIQFQLGPFVLIIFSFTVDYITPQLHNNVRISKKCIFKCVLVQILSLISKFLFLRVCQFNFQMAYQREKECSTHRSGLASILLKKSPAMGFKELINLFKTTSVSTLKYCV